MKPISLLLLLSLVTYADNVQYTFYEGTGAASLVAPGFLPDLPVRSGIPGNLRLYTEDFLYTPCPALAQGGFLQCTIISLTFGGYDGVAVFRIQAGSIQQPGNPDFNGELMYTYGYTDLRQIGTFATPGEQRGIIVNYTAAPVTYNPTPEPRSWLLLSVALIFGISRKRLTQLR